MSNDVTLDLSQANTATNNTADSPLSASLPSPDSDLKDKIAVLRLSNLGNDCEEEHCEAEADNYADLCVE